MGVLDTVFDVRRYVSNQRKAAQSGFNFGSEGASASRASSLGVKAESFASSAVGIVTVLVVAGLALQYVGVV